MADDSHLEGKKAGGKWQKWAENHPIANALDPSAPSVPHRRNDPAFNEGVKEGRKERKNRK